MALLTPNTISILGTAASYVPATTGPGDTVTPGDRVFANVVNARGSSINVTIAVPGSQYGQARPDVVIAVPAGANRDIGPLVADLADPADGQVHLTYSAVASVTVAAKTI